MLSKILIILAILVLPLTSIAEVRLVDIIGPNVRQEVNNPQGRIVRFNVRNISSNTILWMCYRVHLFNTVGLEVLSNDAEWVDCTDILYSGAEPTMVVSGPRRGYRVPTYRVEIEVTQVVYAAGFND